jgi:hypothetical protein
MIKKAGNIQRVLADIRKLLSRSIDTIVERMNVSDTREESTHSSMRSMLSAI